MMQGSGLKADFIHQMSGIFGDEECDALCLALQSEPLTCIRLNERKYSFGIPEDWKRIPWCRDGYYLPNRPSFTMDPLFHAGAYYVQEASSMYLSHILRKYVNIPICALDLCAAPGGKSTLLSSELPAGSVLVSNDINHKRANILQENMSKWHPDAVEVVVTNNSPADFGRLGTEVFDFLLCDVPCSGEGMFRKDEKARDEWSLANVDHCWRRQREIVRDIWPLLKPGGLMVYSTCTFNLMENEANVKWIVEELGAEILDSEPLPEWNIVGNLMDGENFPCCHFFPHKVCGEGFFCAVLRKGVQEFKDAEGSRDSRKIPHHQLSKLRVIPLAYQDNGDDVFQCDVSYDIALRYLHGEAITLPADTPRGMVVITYKNLPLGMAKNIGSRANNLYPKEWRIRKKY